MAFFKLSLFCKGTIPYMILTSRSGGEYWFCQYMSVSTSYPFSHTATVGNIWSWSDRATKRVPIVRQFLEKSVTEYTLTKVEISIPTISSESS